MPDDATKPAAKASDMYRTPTSRDWPRSVRIDIDYNKWYEKGEDLKYATNPFHAAAVYNPDGNTPLFQLEKTGKGGPSQTNYEDVDRALRILRMIANLGSAPAVAVLKHVNPTGVSMKADPLQAFSNAWDADARAAYGGTVAFNFPLDAEFLGKAYAHIKNRDPKTFIDVMVAPGFTDDAREFMSKKESIRICRYDADRIAQIDPFAKGKPEIKTLMDGRIIVYEPYVEAVRSRDDLKIMTTHLPTDSQVADMLFAWYVCANTRSNGVVFACDSTVQAIGTGKQERIDAIEDAIRKAETKAVYRGGSAKDCLVGAVLASDGFIPNIDNIPPLKEKGVTAIIQPGGSKVADEAVIAACDKEGIAMAFTNWRCFSHH